MQTILQNRSLRTAPSATLGELIEHVNEVRRDHHDLVTRADQLYVDDSSGCLVARQAGYREFKLKPLALSQIAARLGVPGQYLAKCPSELVAENINHWLAEQPDRPFLIRCDGDHVRAVLSARYSPVDHDLLLRWVSEAVGRDTRVRYELTEQQLVLQIIDRQDRGTSTDRLHSGVSIRNSEVGLSAVEVSGLVYRTICLNGLILSGQENYRRRHIGDTSLRDQVRRAIQQTTLNAQQGAARFEGTQGIRVPDMESLFERIGSRHSLTKRQGSAIREAFTIEPGETLYAAINAITRAGNSSTLDLEDRRQLQELGGNILAASVRGASWLN